MSNIKFLSLLKSLPTWHFQLPPPQAYNVESTLEHMRVTFVLRSLRFHSSLWRYTRSPVLSNTWLGALYANVSWPMVENHWVKLRTKKHHGRVKPPLANPLSCHVHPVASFRNHSSCWVERFFITSGRMRLVCHLWGCGKNEWVGNTIKSGGMMKWHILVRTYKQGIPSRILEGFRFSGDSMDAWDQGSLLPDFTLEKPVSGELLFS